MAMYQGDVPVSGGSKSPYYYAVENGYKGTETEFYTALADLTGQKVYMTKVTLPASGWDSSALAQTVAVSGILADDTKQLIQAVPAPASMAAATEAGVYCSGQGADSLVFTCASVPAEDIVFNVSYQGATFVS